MKTILQKLIADSGYCSRRRAEELIRSGLVTVNGILAEPGTRADADDDISIGGKKMGLQKKKIYIKLYKPRGYTSTNRKFKEEGNVFELLPRHDDPAATSLFEKGRSVLHIVGRLDKDSRGLVLLTNDGALTQRLTHPKFEHEKRYVVKIKSDKIAMSDGPREVKRVTSGFVKGVDIGEGDGAVRAKSSKYLGGDEFEVILTEGKKRQIRRMFKVLGYDVTDIKRTAIGKLGLGGLREGEWKYLDKGEIEKLT
ncbi:MAG: pseudouridine synthase [Candidatus Falkowbacteria bacterium]